MALFKVVYNFEVVDVNGDTATVRVESADTDAAILSNIAANSAAMGTAIINASNGKMIKRSATALFDEAHLIVGTAPPTNAEYSSVTDGARLQFANSIGERSSLTVPAAKESDFGPSSNVVDSTNANIAALIAQYIGLATDSNAVPLDLYKGGIKVGRRARRRRSSLVP